MARSLVPRGALRAGPGVKEERGKGQKETQRDHQPHGAPAASDTTGPYYSEDSSSWPDAAFPQLCLSEGGQAPPGHPHPRDPGPTPE